MKGLALIAVGFAAAAAAEWWVRHELAARVAAPGGAAALAAETQGGPARVVALGRCGRMPTGLPYGVTMAVSNRNLTRGFRAAVGYMSPSVWSRRLSIASTSGR